MNGLTRFEQTILEALKAREGEVVTTEELEKALYPQGPSPNPNSNGLEVFISRIRRKIGDARKIETKRGRGYVLLPEQQMQEQPS